MICEMCGTESNKLILVETDGAMLKVCPNCGRFGQAKKEEAPPIMTGGGGGGGNISYGSPKPRGAYTKDVFDKMGDDELVDEYGKVIRVSREALHMSQEDLAKKINEKKSIIAKLESESMMPPDALVKKLEKALSVKLTEKYESKTQSNKPTDSGGVTLGDLVKYDD